MCEYNDGMWHDIHSDILKKSKSFQVFGIDIRMDGYSIIIRKKIFEEKN